MKFNTGFYTGICHVMLGVTNEIKIENYFM
jgi:hypothetical protein